MSSANMVWLPSKFGCTINDYPRADEAVNIRVFAMIIFAVIMLPLNQITYQFYQRFTFQRMAPPIDS
jgi:hypothetical protein